MTAGGGDDGDGRESVNEGLGDSAVWTISPRMKDDTPRWEGVPARGALSISVCRKRSSYARIGRRRAATGECRSGIGMTVTALLFQSKRKCARADHPLYDPVLVP